MNSSLSPSLRDSPEYSDGEFKVRWGSGEKNESEDSTRGVASTNLLAKFVASYMQEKDEETGTIEGDSDGGSVKDSEEQDVQDKVGRHTKNRKRALLRTAERVKK